MKYVKHCSNTGEVSKLARPDGRASQGVNWVGGAQRITHITQPSATAHRALSGNDVERHL